MVDGWLIRFACVAALGWLCGCAPEPIPNPAADLGTLPQKPVRAQVPGPSATALVNGAGSRHTQVRSGPAPPAPAQAASVPAESAVALSGAPVNLTIEQMPLNTFVNTVFGETLHLNFEIDPRLAQRTDVVTLRTGRPLPPGEILALARSVLGDYGLQVITRGQLVRIVPNEGLSAQSPSIIRGRSSADVPENLRPIFEYVPLKNVGGQEMANWLGAAYGAKLKITPSVNAVLLLGAPEDVTAADDAVRTLDQPRLAGRRSIKIEPSFWSATQLADRLVEILRAEGYSASTSLTNPGAIIVLPLRPANSLVVFAADQKTIEHVEQWARDLDRVSQVDPQKSLFYYGVRNTTAESLASVLNAVLQGNAAAGTRPAALPSATEAAGSAGTASAGTNPPGAAAAATAVPAASAAQAPAPGTPPPGRLVTDPARNAIIFQGSAEEFGQLRPLIESLDQATREAIIEVTVAEVTLTNNQTLGVEGLLRYGALGQPHQQIQTTGTGIGLTGLNYTIFNAAGATRMVLNALAADTRVKVLSTPKLLSRSGGEARIQVGAQVPIVTSQGTSSQLQAEGTSAILQSIQYKDTGVILTVKPTIYAGDQVDLELKQEVSEAVQNTTSGLSTPVINTRVVNTQLSLHDGATVLIGGLIAENSSDSSTGVPYLKDIPLVGNLFQTQQVAKTRSELFVFITPYILNSGEDAARLTDEFKKRYESLPQPASTLRW
ncbi:MAG: hypothetical protein JO305_10065 [Alphaproteobacteria bacterium]|nr:hypothetical protein [Alphaproteobacteria bacterium]